LLTGAVRRANRVALAMDARAFGGQSERTYRVRMTVDRADWLFVAASLTLIGGLVLGLWFAGITRFTLG
jgi:energy-coupling factor transport system permease protein